MFTRPSTDAGSAAKGYLEEHDSLFVANGERGDLNQEVAAPHVSGEGGFDFGRLPPSPPTTVAVIESIATGVPSRVVDQLESAARVAAMFSDPQQQARIPRIYQKTRVDTRRMAVDPLDPEFDALRRGPRTIRDRMNLFHEHATPLAVDVAGRALAGVPDGAAQIGLLVFVTSTGFIAPGVDVAVVKELGLSPSVSRVVVNFMGCAAAMNGIRTATDFVRANPDRKAMVVCLELCSVNAVFADDINDVIIHSLFGDGCGAVIVGASQVQHRLAPGKVVIRSNFSRLFDDAEDGIVLGVNHNGITCELSENLPGYIYGGVNSVISEVLQRNGLQKSDVDLWAIHPGGPKIIEESVRSLGIDIGQAAVSWDVLARFGNMLSVSLIFVLEEMVRRGDTTKPISTGIAFSFAPGVAVEGMLFDVIRR
jgi:alpha-pyrone synthase